MPKKITSQKFSSAQAEAVGYTFGISNLASFLNEKQTFDIIKKYAPDWSKVVRALRSEMGRQCESDEMFEGALEECQTWVKAALKEDKYIVEEWGKRCRKYEVPEEYIFVTKSA